MAEKRDTIVAKHKAIQEEYDRLVREEYEQDPLKARFIAKGYYITLIAQNPSFGISGHGYITKIINGCYDRKRSK